MSYTTATAAYFLEAASFNPKMTRSLISTQAPSAAAWSFRDPAGKLISIDGRVLRIVNPVSRQQIETILSSQVVQRFIREGKLVATKPVDFDDPNLPAEVRQQLLTDPGASVVEHELVWFPSFPYEWAPEMLYAAGELTLNLAEALAAEDLGLKDGTPFNVLFRGPQPLFIDVLSIECRDPRDPVWLPHAQFVRTFLLPLLVNRYYRTPIDRVFVTNREGLEPEEVYLLAGWWKRLRPLFLSLVSMPTWLSAHKDSDDSIYRARRLQNVAQARFVLGGVLRRLRNTLKKLEPPMRSSIWSDYTQMAHYSDQQTATKLDFVQSAAEYVQAKKVLDIGCNTGGFSIACAKNGADVVAVDYDAVVVGLLWRRASVEKLRILPRLVGGTEIATNLH
ncbi:MAG: SAM-dependent methyltransferase [Acidobacteria bacterium]|nr:MAG: SAM-dependent methyltransferase [Acidobacteriota bacterium]